MIALLALACGAAPVAVPASEPTPALNLTPADLGNADLSSINLYCNWFSIY